jgi:hypothetical protein
VITITTQLSGGSGHKEYLSTVDLVVLDALIDEFENILACTIMTDLCMTYVNNVIKSVVYVVYVNKS